MPEKRHCWFESDSCYHQKEVVCCVLLCFVTESYKMCKNSSQVLLLGSSHQELTIHCDLTGVWHPQLGTVNL